MPDEHMDMQKKLAQKRNKELLAYAREMLARDGVFPTLRRSAKYIQRRYFGKKSRFLPKKAALAAQRAADTSAWPLISVLLPVYNPPEEYFAQLLDSVLGQTYQRWQLCVADAGSSDAARRMIAECGDKRILYVASPGSGISANTNAAAKLATGEYIALLDHDDILAPHALYEMAKAAHQTGAGFLYSDEALFTKDIRRPSVGHFKPDYSPQYLLCCNYITHLAAIRRDVFEQVGGFNPARDGSQDHDLFLRVLEQTGGAVHIPKVLYYWRQHAASTSTGTAAKPYVRAAAIDAINAHLARTGRQGSAADGLFPSTYRVHYAIQGSPLVSIIIPSHNHTEDLRCCLESIYSKTTWQNFEVIIVENGSQSADTFAFYAEAEAKYPRCRVVTWQGDAGFNFSAVCNFGRAEAQGEYILLLNNDTELISADWLQEMLQLCQLPEVGVVGAMLYYPDDTVQHAGIIVGLGGYAGHSHKYAARGKSGYMFRQACVQELSAVTGACLMAKASVYDELGGLDEGFTVAYNDVDFCLRVRQAGHSVLFTPYAELYHHESKSRGSDEDGPALQRFKGEQARLRARYGDDLLHDPFYNPSLTADREDFSESDILPEM